MQRLLAFTLLGSAAAFKPIEHYPLAAYYATLDAIYVCGGRNYDNNCAVVDDGTADNHYIPSRDDANGIPIANWDVSDVTTMEELFEKSDFNGDISAWDVGQVTDMHAMFSQASAFTGDLSAWDVSRVTNMMEMFYEASAFNQDLSAWDVGRVTNMQQMFYSASAFNQDLSAWDVGRVTNMNAMFSGASTFNQDLSAWNVGQDTTTDDMFREASAFNQQLCGAWVNSVSNPEHTFYGHGGLADTGCALCPIGQKSIGEPSSAGQENCQTCAGTAGTGGGISLRAGQTICLACPTETPHSSGTTCTGCSAGKYADRGVCSNCPVGKYRADADPVNQCVPCSAGKYGTGEEQPSEADACTNCPSGTTSNAGANGVGDCDVCPTGFWSHAEVSLAPCLPRSTNFNLVQLEDSACAAQETARATAEAALATEITNRQAAIDQALGSQVDGSDPSALANAVRDNPTAYQMAGLCN